ncbi:hypothetical protein EIP91_007559 [Steccherinum ochraceum]|uniref:F-box domain-containing protein n=1 Tax=Steccherinum ochraceum TaxID=92696 RepID=A0A4R0S0P0_9APHY|nr:hypothetical protein EIP91_007559 [Steccherinum ochraceum]
MIATELSYDFSGRLALKGSEPSCTAKPSQLTTLPLRIVFAILSHLVSQDLLRCSQTCNTLRRVVKAFPALQYKIELAAVGMQNIPENTLTDQKKLSLLRRYLRNWSHLSWPCLTHTLATTFDCDKWEISGGVITHMNHNLEVQCTRLGSSIEGRPTHKWVHPIRMDKDIRDYFVDLYQDLLLVVVTDDDVVAQALLLSFTKGGTHPSAQMQALELPASARSTNHFHIRGDKLACLSFWDVTGWQGYIFTVWNWHTGQVIMSYDSAAHSDVHAESPDIIQRDYHMFTFLDDKHIAFAVSVTSTEDIRCQAFIEIIDFTKGYEAFATSVNFHFPKIAKNTLIVEASVARNPAPPPTLLQEHAPFCTSEDETVVAMSVGLCDLEEIDDYLDLAFFIPTNRLLHLYHEARAPPTSLSVSWTYPGSTGVHHILVHPPRSI